MWDVAEWQFSISLQCQHCAVGLSSAPPRPAQPSCPYGRVSTQPRADPTSTGGTDAFPPRAPQHLSAGNRAAARSSATQSCLHSSSPGCSAGADPKAHMEVHTAVHIVRHVGRSRATHTAAHSPAQPPHCCTHPAVHGCITPWSPGERSALAPSQRSPDTFCSILVLSYS